MGVVVEDVVQDLRAARIRLRVGTGQGQDEVFRQRVGEEQVGALRGLFQRRRGDSVSADDD